jgi:hypothetical protein
MMLMVGLPLICLLTFQLVKDMAVYEMGVAMTPASQMLGGDKEETKIAQLNGELAAIEGKKPTATASSPNWPRRRPRPRPTWKSRSSAMTIRARTPFP